MVGHTGWKDYRYRFDIADPCQYRGRENQFSACSKSRLLKRCKCHLEDREEILRARHYGKLTIRPSPLMHPARSLVHPPPAVILVKTTALICGGIVPAMVCSICVECDRSDQLQKLQLSPYNDEMSFHLSWLNMYDASDINLIAIFYYTVRFHFRPA